MQVFPFELPGFPFVIQALTALFDIKYYQLAKMFYISKHKH